MSFHGLNPINKIKNNPVYKEAYNKFVIDCNGMQDRGECGRGKSDKYGNKCEPLLCFDCYCWANELGKYRKLNTKEAKQQESYIRRRRATINKLSRH